MWDLLIPQAELTLYLLRQSNVTPRISAYAHLHGPFDYNKHPLAPMGSAVQMHEKPTQRKSWAPHSIDGWYIGTSLEHYRAHKIRTKETKAARISDTVYIKHKYLTEPTVTPADAVVAAAQKLTQALKSRQSHHHPQWEALNKLAQQFSKQDAQETEKWNKAAQAVVDPTINPTNTRPAPRVPTKSAQTPRVETLRVAPQQFVLDTAPNAIQPTTTTHYITQYDEEDAA
jgi:hypothetical protein